MIKRQQRIHLWSKCRILGENVSLLEDFERLFPAAFQPFGCMVRMTTTGLLDDHFSDQKIVFSVSARVKDVYRAVISNFGAEDREVLQGFNAWFRRYRTLGDAHEAYRHLARRRGRVDGARSEG